jgi:hypothetical protein
MCASSKIIVSPGIYTSEQDLTFVVQSIGVTTLGLSGEAPKGPAFEPVFIKNFDEYTTFFGGVNPSKYPSLPSLPKYEMGYVAKQYLKQSNQLFITRVLGLSGYNAGKAWTITTYGNIDWYVTDSNGVKKNILDPSVAATTYVSGVDPTWNVYISGSDVYFSDPLSPVFASGGTFDVHGIKFYSQAATGTDNLVTYDDFIGATPSSPLSITGYTKSQVTDCLFYVVTGTITGNTTADTVTFTSGAIFSATCLSEYDKLVVAMIRSRVNTTTDYDIKTDAPYLVRINSTPAGLNDVFFKDIDSINSPYGNFILSGYTKGTSPDYFEYIVNLNPQSKSFISKVLGGAGVSNNCVWCDGPKSKNEPIWVEEVYPTVYTYLVDYEKIYGIKGISRVTDDVSNYGYIDSTGLQPIGFETPSTPWVVSELRGNKVDRLFKFQSISDGEMANVEIKISFMNINLATGEFDVIIRDWTDNDEKLIVLEKYQKCNLDPESNNYIAKKIGTSDGQNELKSRFTMLVMNPHHPYDAVPSGFEGIPMRFDSVEPFGGSVGDLINVRPVYKTKYFDVGEVIYQNPITGYEIQASGDKPPFYRKRFLGFTSVVALDPAEFAYKGYTTNGGIWTVMSKGFHLDIDAANATIIKIDTPAFSETENPTGFEVGDYNFQNEDDLVGTEYETLSSRKFTVTPYGGFDGWDPNRGKRTNGDNYRQGKAAFTTSGFLGTTSDWYAYLAGIQTFNNPESVNINVFGTPGIDYVNNRQLIDEAITMVEEERADSLYIVTTPDVDYGTGQLYSPQDAVDNLTNADLDTNYTSTYYPWVKYEDAINNVSIYLPPTYDVMRNIALTDNIAFPWFATAGYTRGIIECSRARVKLTQDDRDILYESRINPIATFNDVGVLIWGNRTLQVAESALDRMNVRRLLLQSRKLIAAVSKRLVFEQNDDIVRNEFLNLVNPILEGIKNERGLIDFRVSLVPRAETDDENLLRGRIYLKPTRTLEFIDLSFIITPTSASFENI